MTDKTQDLTDKTLDAVTAGQTREHVLLARQVSVPHRVGDDDEDTPIVIQNPDGP